MQIQLDFCGSRGGGWGVNPSMSSGRCFRRDLVYLGNTLGHTYSLNVFSLFFIIFYKTLNGYNYV